MTSKQKIGIIICDRYRRCAGGKCLRAMRSKEGAFSAYAADAELELVGFTTCDGCPGGNIEYAADEMVKNGAEVTGESRSRYLQTAMNVSIFLSKLFIHPEQLSLPFHYSCALSRA